MTFFLMGTAHMRYILLLALLLSSTPHSLAESSSSASTIYPKEKMVTCLQTSIANADESMTVKQLQDGCKLLLEQRKPDETITQPGIITANDNPDARNNPQQIITTTIPSQNKDANKQGTPPRRLFQDRLTMEALNRSNRFILTPHKRNFLLPISYMDHPNTAPYEKEKTPALTDLNHTEAELQLSVKILLRENIFDDNGHLYLGYTNHALWQVYNRRLSAPFREADHQPELILAFTNDLEIFGFNNVINEAILNHQSNGQTGVLSRSWNRIMLNSVFEKDNLTFAFNPWYRLPEEKKDEAKEYDPKGDDNPDIERYMGHFELTGAYKYKSDIFSVLIRNDINENHYGAFEFSWTFPVSKTMRGYFTYFDGYGHSLIDYDYHQKVVGLGIIFTDLF